MSKVWYKVHSANKINPMYLQILLFYGSNCFVCLIKVTLHLLSSKKKKSSSANSDKRLGVQTVKKQCYGCPNDTLDSKAAKPLPGGVCVCMRERESNASCKLATDNHSQTSKTFVLLHSHSVAPLEIPLL